ncbi:MAG: TIR domain-containing protein [Scytolyngbya sp. HA4215-MV1]|jgi:WD40 repeat protein|nr:TIR domain-containing protein [Scytolyngbya sp. HA4215-MV1]
MQAFQDIFISYGRKDSLEFASRLNRRLVDRGFTVWFDYDDIPLGVDYQKQIDDGIERADNFLFIISPHSINSPYCGLELELALKHQKRIIPWLHVEKISDETWQQRTPNGTAEEWADYQAQGLHDHYQNMHPVLRKINWIYGREGQDDFEVAFAGLLNLCDRHKDYVHQHTLFLAKALEWERNQKRSPYLLIGEERLQAEAWLKIRFMDSQPPCLPTDLHCEFISESRKNADNLMSEVFLAYADENRATAEQIRNSLRRTGFTVWTNTTDIQVGAEFQQVIDRGIEEADNVVYLLSPAAVRSPWCQHELEYALSLHKRIIPVLVEAMAPDQIPPGVRELQYIDLTDNVQESDYQLDESQLLQVLQQDAAYHETHKRLLTKALKWERQHRNPTMLLRGYNLGQAEAWLKLAKQMPAYPPLPLQNTLIEESLRQPPGTSLDVFISYSRADSGIARRLNEALQIQGKRTWFDQESIAAGTADFQQEIHRGIASADTFLFILSPRSINSPYCADEVEYAANLNKRFVTLLYQPIDPSTLHPELAKVQWLDFNQREGDFSANFTELLRILDTDTEHLHAHTRLLLRAIEWDHQGRKESLLLRGDDLELAEQWFAQSVGKAPQPTELQHSYVTTSRSVEDANQQANQILKAAAAKGKRLVTVGAVAGAIGLLIAGVSGWFAWQATNQIKVAELKLKTTAANEQVLSGQQFQALLTALESGQTLKTQFRLDSSDWNELQPRIMAILQKTTSELREKNTLKGHQDWVGSLSYSPNGKTIASGSSDKTIKLWDAATGKLLHTLEGHQNPVWSVSYSPDGKTIASGSFDKTVKLWDVATGKLLHTLEGHQDRVTSISYSPDGKTIVSGSFDKTVKLWDAATGKLLRTLQEHQDPIWSVSYSPDGKTIASGSFDKTIKLWDAATGKLLNTLQGHQDGVTSIRYSPDGKTISSGSFDKTIKLWDAATGKLLHTLQGHQGTVWSVSYSPDGKTIASSSQDKTIKLWDAATGKLLNTLQGHQGEVTSIRFSFDGKTIASSSFDKTIKLWDVSPDQQLNTLKGHQLNIWSISYSPDSKTIASGSADKTIKLWDAATGKLLNTLQGHQYGVTSIRYSPDGKTIASGSADKTIKLWDAATGKLLHTLQGHQGTVWSVSYSPDGKTIASGSDDKTVKLWDAATGKLLHTLQGHQGTVWSVSYSPDGKTIASGSFDKTIKLWDAATGKPLNTLQGHQDGVTSIRYSPDGKTITSGSADNTIKRWDAATGKLLHTLEGHQDRVTSISYSPDGKTIASGSFDKTIKLWDAATGKLLNTLEGHQDLVWSVSFSPDGKTIASGGQDKTIKLWVWDFDLLMTIGCDWIQDYLIAHPEQRHLCKGYSPQPQ